MIVACMVSAMLFVSAKAAAAARPRAGHAHPSHDKDLVSAGHGVTDAWNALCAREFIPMADEPLIGCQCTKSEHPGQSECNPNNPNGVCCCSETDEFGRPNWCNPLPKELAKYRLKRLNPEFTAVVPVGHGFHGNVELGQPVDLTEEQAAIAKQFMIGYTRGTTKYFINLLNGRVGGAARLWARHNEDLAPSEANAGKLFLFQMVETDHDLARPIRVTHREIAGHGHLNSWEIYIGGDGDWLEGGQWVPHATGLDDLNPALDRALSFKDGQWVYNKDFGLRMVDPEVQVPRSKGRG